MHDERVQLLSGLASSLLLSDDPREILDDVFEKLSAHLGLEAYFNYLVTGDGSRLRLYNYAGIPDHMAREIEWLDYGQAICGCVARDRMRIIAEDVQCSADPRTDLIRSLGITAYCCHPLIAHDRLIGTLSFGTRNRALFAPDEIELMRVVCNLIASALDRASLVARLNRVCSEQDALIIERTSALQKANEDLKRQMEERRSYEEALQNSKADLGALFNAIRESAFLMEPDGTIVAINDSTAQLSGSMPGDLQGKNMYEIMLRSLPRALVEDRHIRVNEVLRTGKPARWVDERNNRTIDNSVYPVFSADGRVVRLAVFGRDVTRERAATQALRRSEAKYRELVENANSIIMRWDMDGRITFFNEYAQRFFGYSRDEIIGRNVSVLLPATDSFGQDLTSLVGDIMRHPERFKSNINENICKDGRRVWVSWTNKAIRDRQGNMVEILVVGNDATERKRAEEELKETKQQAELYLDLMSHDISNMHQIILGQLELAQDVLGSEGKLESGDREMIDVSVTTLHRSARLIDSIRNAQTLRSGGCELERTDLGALLGEAVKGYSQAPGRGITISYAPVQECYVRANALLKEVFQNLLDNAIKHCGAPAKIDVYVCPVVQNGNGSRFCQVMIEDNGSGIPDGEKDKVFNRLKRVQTGMRGTGLGLYIVKTLVEGFGGNVRVEDRVPGDFTKGARFVVVLPVV